MTLVADVDGWMSPGQASTLYDSATRCPAGGSIVEIGSFRGRSTIVLAIGGRARRRGDRHRPPCRQRPGPPGVRRVRRGGRRRPRGVPRQPRTRRRRRPGAAPADVLRRCPRRRSCTRSTCCTSTAPTVTHRRSPTSATTGSGWPTAARCSSTTRSRRSASRWPSCGRWLFGSTFRYVGRSRSMTIYRADLAASGTGRVRNAGRQLAQLPWFARNVALKVLLTLGARQGARSSRPPRARLAVLIRRHGFVASGAL